MTIDEAIKHAEEVADFCEDSASKYDITDAFESYMACQDGKCAEEHRQLAKWLRDYKRLLEQQPCDDCISRKDFIAKVKDIYYGYMLDDDGCCPQDFVDLAEEMPFVTPQVKIGYWIRCDILQELKCSECRRCFRNKTNFCPNCGTRMVEPQERSE